MLIGAVDYFPQNYGPKTVQLAVAILSGCPTPPAVYTDHMLITPDNIASIYPDDLKEVPQLIAQVKFPSAKTTPFSRA
jgi:ABC-type sugar transport system substrate-binding protein